MSEDKDKRKRKNNDGTGNSNKTGGGNNSTNKNCGSKGNSAAKCLLLLARQDKQMAERQNLLQTFLQIGASTKEVKEVYAMYPDSLSPDTLFEAGKLDVSKNILKFLLEALEAKVAKYERRGYFYFQPRWYTKKFTLKRDPHLLTSGNVLLGLSQVLLSNVVSMNICSPESGKPFWNFEQFLEFLGEVIKSKHLKNLYCTFPKDPKPPKQSSPRAAAATVATALAPSPTDSTIKETQALEELQPPKEAKKPKVCAMAKQVQSKLVPKKLESCILQDVRIKFDYSGSHKTSASLLQFSKSLANMPSLKTFAIQTQKEIKHAQDFRQFKADLTEALGKLLTTSKTLESLIVDAKDLTSAEWESLLKSLEKNPSLKRLLIRGFRQPKDLDAAVTKAQRPGVSYSKDQVRHISLVSFKRKLLKIVQDKNTTLTDVRFVIPDCLCDSKLIFDAEDCFQTLKDAKPLCSPCLTNNWVAGCRPIPPPNHVPELAHLLMLNANGRAKLLQPSLTHRQMMRGVTKDNKFLSDVSVLYTLLRSKTEYIPMLYSQIRQQSKKVASSEIDELYLAAAGKLALPVERFADLCVRRSDDFSALYDLLRLFPTIWLDHLRTAKQIIQEQTKRSKKDYVSVVELVERTQIVKKRTKKSVPKGDAIEKISVYETRVVKTIDAKASKEETKKPLKVIRLNVAPSVGGATSTKFPRLAIGQKGQLVPRRKKKPTENTGASNELINDPTFNVAPKPNNAKKVLKDRSNKSNQATVIPNLKKEVTATTKAKKTKPATTAKSAKRRGGATPKSKTKKVRRSRTVDSLLKMNGSFFANINLDGIDDDSDEAYEPPVDAEKPTHRRSVARRKVRPAKRKSSQSPLAEILGVSSDEEQADKEGGDDSDWDEPEFEEAEADLDESDWEY